MLQSNMSRVVVFSIGRLVLFEKRGERKSKTEHQDNAI